MTKRTLAKAFLFFLTVLVSIAIGYGAFFIYKVYWLEKKISAHPSPSLNKNILDTFRSLSSKEINLQSTDQRINILLLGLPGKGKTGTNLTDTIMIASLNTSTNQVALLSIPRDFYVEIPDTRVSMKINSVYQHEMNRENADKAAQTMKEIVSRITSLDIHYYLIVNFEGFTEVIDAVDGINITNERDIYDSRYPGPNYSYEVFELKKGFHHLDGATALKYARERHDDPEGDFGRAKRQQQILQATKNKVFSTKTLLNPVTINDTFNSLGDNIKTDISPEEFDDFLMLAQILDTNNITNVVLDAWNKNSLLKVSHVFFGPTRAFILIPRVGNYSEIHELAENIFDLNKIKRRQEEIVKEDATIVIINKSGDYKLEEKIKKLLNENFSYKNVIIVQDPKKEIIKDQTIVYDLVNRNKPFTLDELITKLPASTQDNFPDFYKDSLRHISTDIVIVLGKDLVSHYNMEEASFEEYNSSEDTNEYQEFLNQ